MLPTSRSFLIDSSIQLWLETALGDQVHFQGCVFSTVTHLLSVFSKATQFRPQSACTPARIPRVFSTVSKLFCVFSTVTHLLSPGLGYVAFEKIHKECDTLEKTLVMGLHKVGEVGHFEEIMRFVS